MDFGDNFGFCAEHISQDCKLRPWTIHLSNEGTIPNNWKFNWKQDLLDKSYNVMLDIDLAEMYGVETKRLKRVTKNWKDWV